MLDLLEQQKTAAALSPTGFRPLPLDSDPLDILLVEDVTSDALLLRHALDAAHVPYQLHGLRKGDEVMPWLARELKIGHTLPDLLMLDLNLPRMDGFEILSELTEASPTLRAVPIVILTGYDDFDYVRKGYNNLCIPAYIAKPCTAGKIRETLAGLFPGKFAAEH